MNRHEQRKKIFQLLFQIDHEVVALNEAAFYDFLDDYSYIKDVVSYYEHNKENVDDYISKHLKNYTLERISKSERNVLRMAVSELLLQDSPPRVIINEAVKIIKLYGDKDSYKFVNGVLKNFPALLEGMDDNSDGKQ
ncbi:transcription antitermination factor NusB [Salinicoccus sp. Marseille-QA3877]